MTTFVLRAVSRSALPLPAKLARLPLSVSPSRRRLSVRRAALRSNCHQNAASSSPRPRLPRPSLPSKLSRAPRSEPRRRLPHFVPPGVLRPRPVQQPGPLPMRRRLLRRCVRPRGLPPRLPLQLFLSPGALLGRRMPVQRWAQRRRLRSAHLRELHRWLFGTRRVPRRSVRVHAGLPRPVLPARLRGLFTAHRSGVLGPRFVSSHGQPRPLTRRVPLPHWLRGCGLRDRCRRHAGMRAWLFQPRYVLAQPMHVSRRLCGPRLLNSAPAQQHFSRDGRADDTTAGRADLPRAHVALRVRCRALHRGGPRGGAAAQAAAQARAYGAAPEGPGRGVTSLRCTMRQLGGLRYSEEIRPETCVHVPRGE